MCADLEGVDGVEDGGCCPGEPCLGLHVGLGGAVDTRKDGQVVSQFQEKTTIEVEQIRDIGDGLEICMM